MLEDEPLEKSFVSADKEQAFEDALLDNEDEIDIDEDVGDMEDAVWYKISSEFT